MEAKKKTQGLPISARLWQLMYNVAPKKEKRVSLATMERLVRNSPEVINAARGYDPSLVQQIKVEPPPAPEGLQAQNRFEKVRSLTRADKQRIKSEFIRNERYKANRKKRKVKRLGHGRRVPPRVPSVES